MDGGGVARDVQAETTHPPCFHQNFITYEASQAKTKAKAYAQTEAQAALLEGSGAGPDPYREGGTGARRRGTG